jgi:hypothetical protein
MLARSIDFEESDFNNCQKVTGSRRQVHQQANVPAQQASTSTAALPDQPLPSPSPSRQAIAQIAAEDGVASRPCLRIVTEAREDSDPGWDAVLPSKHAKKSYRAPRRKPDQDARVFLPPPTSLGSYFPFLGHGATAEGQARASPSANPFPNRHDRPDQVEDSDEEMARHLLAPWQSIHLANKDQANVSLSLYPDTSISTSFQSSSPILGISLLASPSPALSCRSTVSSAPSRSSHTSHFGGRVPQLHFSDSEEDELKSSRVIHMDVDLPPDHQKDVELPVETIAESPAAVESPPRQPSPELLPPPPEPVPPLMPVLDGKAFCVALHL